MLVVATAGHVDHGKSTLVRALTGMDPDTHTEEQRRGLTIDLGFAWADLDGLQVAFVDVPGHERFVATMLAGVGPVPAVLLVVAADGGWMPQSQEHLDALDALRVAHGLIVVTRSDLADPTPALAEARERLGGTSLASIPALAVSAVRDPGLAELRTAITAMAARFPSPDVRAPVRLWVDRTFSIKGAGTVVTGTLGAGSLRRGDSLALPSGRVASIRGLHSLGRSVSETTAVARVAVNLRGVSLEEVAPGDALTTPGSHLQVRELDVRLAREVRLPTRAHLHIGASRTPARVRPLGPLTARLQLDRSLPLRIGDLAILRDPGQRHVLTGVQVLDVDPPALRQRGAARSRAQQLDAYDGTPDAVAELRRRRVVRRSALVAMGVPPEHVAQLPSRDPDWALDPDHERRLRADLGALVAEHYAADALADGVPLPALRESLDLAEQRLVSTLVTPPLRVESGRVVDPRRQSADALPAPVAQAVHSLRRRLADMPFAAANADELADLGLGPRELAAAVRVGALVRVGEGVYLTAEAVRHAGVIIRDLPQPFTTSQARQAWSTSRRVALPLLALLDEMGVTTRLPDDTRRARMGTRPD